MKRSDEAEDYSVVLLPAWVAGGLASGLLALQVASRFGLWGTPGVVHLADAAVAGAYLYAAHSLGRRLAGTPGPPLAAGAHAWVAWAFGAGSLLLLVAWMLGAVPWWAVDVSAVGKGVMVLLSARLLALARVRLSGGRAFRAMILNPPATVVLSFAVAVLFGWLLLCLPDATPDRQPLRPLDALFTATSATCVTGLIVLDTPRDFSLFGQLVILALIQAGGLGIMTLAGVFKVFAGRRMSLQQRLVAHDTVVMHEWRGIGSTFRSIALYALAFEAAGAVVLWLRWWAGGAGSLESAWLAVFHSISAFCNAGFSLFSTSLEGYAGDLTINVAIAGLIIVGGIGFPVFVDVVRWLALRRQGLRARLSLHSRLVLVTTAGLLAAGFVGFLLLEAQDALAGRGPAEALTVAAFQSISPRTAGFNTVPVDQLLDATKFLLVLLMLVGASPGSAGGGMKTATLAVMVCLARTMIQGGSNVHVFGRAIPEAVRHRAMAIVILFGVCVLAWTFALSVSESARFMDILFETVSAFGTVGLSAGITFALTTFGRLAIIAAMFMGRVGPLTLSLAVAQRQRRVDVKYPEEPVMVG